MKLQFLGANRQVTGSRYCLRHGDLCLLIDCGMYQERRYLERNWAPSPVDPGTIDYVLLTHAHLDHCGLVPKLAKAGYAGPVLATAPSIDLARLVMEDAGHIQEEDAEYKRRRHRREGRKSPRPVEPLFTKDDAVAASKLFRRVQLDEVVTLDDAVSVVYRDSGHILGSAILEVQVRENGRTRRIVFSGDLGQSDSPLMNDPAVIKEADHVVMESTYGDRDHHGPRDLPDELARIITETAARGGTLVVPTFAIDRAQDLLYYIGQLGRDKRIPRVGVSLDSPMAISATTIYKEYRHLLDDETQALIRSGNHPFQFKGLHFSRSRDDSRRIKSMDGPHIILAGSGMCTGGRIKHHLRANIERPESTILFVGYQAPGTLGRLIVDRAETVRIHGRHYEVRAHVEQVSGLSAHADRRGLMRWLGNFESPPQSLFLTHGEGDVAESLAKRVKADLGWNVSVPNYEETVNLG